MHLEICVLQMWAYLLLLFQCFIFLSTQMLNGGRKWLTVTQLNACNMNKKCPKNTYMVMINIIFRWIIIYDWESAWSWYHGTFHHKPLFMSHCWFMWHLKLEELQIFYETLLHMHVLVQLNYCVCNMQYRYDDEYVL